MTESQAPEGKLTAEFRELARNLVGVLQAAWDQPERKRLQQEIANGLNEMGQTLQEETQKFVESPTGQRLKSNVENVTQRVQSGEVEIRVRQELLSALQAANNRLQEAANRLSERQSPDMAARGEEARGRTAAAGDAGSAQTGPAQGREAESQGQGQQGSWDELYPRSEGHQEVHPDDVNAPPAETGHDEVHPDDVEA